MEICKAMIVIKTSIFPASKEEVFNKFFQRQGKKVMDGNVEVVNFYMNQRGN